MKILCRNNNFIFENANLNDLVCFIEKKIIILTLNINKKNQCVVCVNDLTKGIVGLN